MVRAKVLREAWALSALRAPIPPTSILGAILLIGYLGGAMASHVRIGSPLFSHVLFGFYLGGMLWGGLWLRDRKLRALMPLRSQFTSSTITVREHSVFEIIAVLAVVLAVAIAIVLILAATKPDTFSVQRAAVVKAPPEKIFSLINDFHRWGTWSPWENKDPAMKRTYSGAESGNGAVYAWDGNKNVGSGRMEILDASSPSKIVIKLDFFKPFEAHNTAEFTMLPQGDAGTTNINWVMHGPAPFMSKVMQVFMNIDSMVGKDFEIGLANLKRLTEK